MGGGCLPDISSISTCEALSFSVRVFEREEGVMLEEDAIVEAWVSVWAAPVVMVREWGKRNGSGSGWGWRCASRGIVLRSRERVRMRCMEWLVGGR